MRKNPVPRRSAVYARNLIRFAAGTLAAGLLVAFYGILPFQYAEGRAHPPRLPVCCATPADWEIPFAEIEIPSEAGILLRGWYIRSRNGAAVIVAHGLGGNRISVLPQGIALAEEGFGVLLLDARAHGESGGETVTFGGGDILSAAAFLREQEDVSGKIGILGISLGGLQAIQAAAAEEDIAGVLADGAGPNAFADVPVWISPMRLLELPFQWVGFQVWKLQGVPGPLPVTEALGLIAPRPVLLISGARGDYEREMQRKFLRAAGESCTLWEVPEAGHTESWDKRTGEYRQRMIAFFRDALLSI
ncbi:MAG: alpha/beta fold hydrolase [Anaerolineales bacterium]|nr:alpha/beta fold hydrolase [Anaerolineales bacterium]